MKTQKVKLIKDIIAVGKSRKAGDIIELPEQDARFVISRKMAKDYKGNAKAINEEIVETDNTQE
ncbi:hypothetical protein [Francisella hispaniensis]|uniref:Uncharacterized protein n=1 Tax=Francisella hispaniensis TaxID=622488 RepID=F4BFR0_9GAMM|nr:hypothetical protein [Francisella hispaniensis]AEE26304.1 hypothetical protein FN3523_1001 [Francisella hispaniensis]